MSGLQYAMGTIAVFEFIPGIWDLSPRGQSAGLDLCTKIIGWTMHDYIRAELAIAGLTMAVQKHKPLAGSIRHSDRGDQQAVAEYRQRIAAANPQKEFAAIKTELVHKTRFPARERSETRAVCRHRRIL